MILHAYEEYGEENCESPEGSYALVIWDSIRERLFAARDAQGGRELYYALAGGRLAFATCLSSVMTLYRIRERDGENLPAAGRAGIPL